jgi:hypothetical protein
MGNEGRGMEFPFTLLMIGLFFAITGNRSSNLAEGVTLGARERSGAS